MNKQPVLILRNITKRYRPYRDKTLKGVVKSFLTNAQHKEIIPIRELSLTCYRGEILGVIGPNGSGKTTLLKLMAGITYPTSGNIIRHGLIVPIIELGIGLHPELTGDENALMLGVILGIPRAKISKKINTILQFAGLQNFHDVPVKQYSTGMKTRLSFSLAIHSDFDLLLLDEIFAIGDIKFQDQALKTLRSLQKKGKAIVLVSHDLSFLRSFCNRILWLNPHKLSYIGAPKQIINRYIKNQSVHKNETR